jgi:hypothetical protein
MEAARASETLVNFYQATRRYNPEDSHLHTHRRENLKSYCVLYNSAYQSHRLDNHFLQINSMELNPPWGSNISSACQGIRHVSWNPKVHYRVHKSPPHGLTLSHTNAVSTSRPFPYIFFSHQILSSVFPSGVPIRILYAFPVFSRHPINYGALHHAIFSNLPPLHPSNVQIFFLVHCSQTPSICVLTFMWETKHLQSVFLRSCERPNTFNLCSYVHVRDQILHPNKTIDKL